MPVQRKLFVSLLISLFTLALCGCDRSLPATVTGTVTIDGRAVDSVVGEVMFHPSGGGAMAMASLQSDGTYTINTGSTKGLEPGSYDVTVRVAKVSASDGQNAPGQKQLSPQKYGVRESSDLTAEVESGPNTFDFDLQSK